MSKMSFLGGLKSGRVELAGGRREVKNTKIGMPGLVIFEKWVFVGPDDTPRGGGSKMAFFGIFEPFW